MKRIGRLAAIFTMVIALAASVVARPGETRPGKGNRTFTGRTLQEVRFPLGGIGSGCVSLGGRGDLKDWEIFNRPDKGGGLDLSFFAIWVKAKGREPVARILERKIMPPFIGGGHGVAQRNLSGLPRFDEAEFTGEYPFAKLALRDKSVPVGVSLTAWNPYVPLDVDASSLPAAILVWEITNPSTDTVSVSVAATLANPIGGKTETVKPERPGLGKNLNQYIDKGDFRGLFLSSAKMGREDLNYGTMALLTTWSDLDVQTRWYRGGWWDQCHMFWDDFSDDGKVADVRDAVPSADGTSDVGSLILHAAIAPGGVVRLPVIITWHFPNRENYWNGEQEVRGKSMKNYVAGKYEDAFAVGAYVVGNLPRLESETRAFHDALFGSSYPPSVLDAVSSQMSILKTNVCILLKDGSFFGFEGSSDRSGCCPLNCTHVWNYEQTLAYLFPSLERSMRETDFLHNTLPNGYMTFRTLIPLGDYWWHFKACADGQFGTIMKAYREWKLSGDNGWLRKIWPKVKLALEFAWNGAGNPPPKGFEWTKEQVSMPWDPDKNGVMEGEQHNTYDIEFYGPNTMTGSLYLGALKAASEMASAAGEEGKAREYAKIFQEGSRLYDKKLWKDDYYIQEVSVMKGLTVPADLVSPAGLCCDKGSQGMKSATGKDSTCVSPKYQYGEGCLSDQLLGQYLAHVIGLGHILDAGHVRKAMKSIYDYNFHATLGEFANVQRVYALNDEGGLLLCSWPHGKRPALPFVYSDEVWTGIEYQAAATMIYNGLVDEGLTVVKAVRDRYDGERRNPYDEEECGHHYARALASWAVLLALSGYQFDGIAQSMTFAPRISGDDFRTFWSSANAWGSFARKKGDGLIESALEVIHGSLTLKSLEIGEIGLAGRHVKALLAGATVRANVKREGSRTRFVFPEAVVVGLGQKLEITLTD